MQPLMTRIALNIMISNPLTTVTYHVLLVVVACLAAELVPALVSVLPLASCRGGARANPAHLQETRAAALCFDFFHRNPRNLIFAIERTLLSTLNSKVLSTQHPEGSSPRVAAQHPFRPTRRFA